MDDLRKARLMAHTPVGRQTAMNLGLPTDEAEIQAAEFSSDHWKDQPRDKGKFAETPGDGHEAADSPPAAGKSGKVKASSSDDMHKLAKSLGIDTGGKLLKADVLKKIRQKIGGAEDGTKSLSSDDMHKVAKHLGIDTGGKLLKADVLKKIHAKLGGESKITTKPPEPAKSEPAEKKSGGFSDFTVQSSSEGGKAVYKLLGKKNGSWETVNQFDNEMDAKESMAETRKKHPTSKQTYQHKSPNAIDFDQTIQDMYEGAIRPTLEVRHIEDRIRHFSFLTKRELASAAKDFGISRSLPNKEAILKAIIQKITDRKGAYERAKV